jgi:hypothetical protein
MNYKKCLRISSAVLDVSVVLLLVSITLIHGTSGTAVKPCL